MEEIGDFCYGVEIGDFCYGVEIGDFCYGWGKSEISATGWKSEISATGTHVPKRLMFCHYMNNMKYKMFLTFKPS
ncbi:MAG: hypothetical protein FWG98_11620 [Candidatus Cloacimonetes bacterium]|nr:hypothetical protein [Candidatus Cloacimonadota bacterium]